jgi:DNA-binding beta-propeller fold protein YncE
MTRRFPLLAATALAVLALAAPAADAEVGLLGTWGGPGSGIGQFSGASAVAVDDRGHVFVADTNNRRVQRFDAEGRFERELGVGLLVAPTGVTADDRGNVFVADTGGNKVVHFDPNGTVLHMWGDASSLPAPTGLAVDRAGSVFVTGAFGDVRRYTPDGHLLASWGGALLDPRSLAVAPDGTVYVADATQLLVQPFSPGGERLARLGGAAFSGPAAVAFDRSTGHLLVADRPSGRIERRATDGTLVSAIGGAPDQPAGVAVDCRGTVFVAEAGGERVQRYGAPGAGSPGECPPVASFDLTAAPRVGAEVTLDATASWATVGRLVRWSWQIDGPGGSVTTTREAPSFTHTFTAPGTHRVRLRVEDDDGDRGEIERTVDVAGGALSRVSSGPDVRPFLRLTSRRMSVRAFRRQGLRVAVGRAPAAARSFTVTVRRAGARRCTVLRRTLSVRGRDARLLHAGRAGVVRRVRLGGGGRGRCAPRAGRHLVSVSFGGGQSAPRPATLGLVRRRSG